MISGLVFDHEFNSWLGSVKRMVLAELARKDDILVVHPGGLCVQARETQVSGGSEDSDARLPRLRCWRGFSFSSAPGS